MSTSTWPLQGHIIIHIALSKQSPIPASPAQTAERASTESLVMCMLTGLGKWWHLRTFPWNTVSVDRIVSPSNSDVEALAPKVTTGLSKWWAFWTLPWNTVSVDWIVFPPKFRCWSPGPQSDGINIWRWAFGRWLGLGEAMRVESPGRTSILTRRERDQGAPFPLHCVRRWEEDGYYKPGIGPHQALIQPEPWSWNPQPSESWEILFSLFKPLSLWWSVRTAQID